MCCLSELIKSGCNWTSISSTLLGIFTLFVSIIQLSINKKLKIIDQKNTERDFRANIFSERYKIYNILHLFFTCIKNTCIEYSSSENEFDISDFQDSVLQKIYKENSDYTGIMLRNDYFDEKEFVKNLQEENIEKERRLNSLKKRYEDFNTYYLKNLIFELLKSEFCFENQEIYKCIKILVDKLLEKIGYTNSNEKENLNEGELENREYSIACEYIKNIQDALGTIENKKIFDEMKKELKLNT